MQTRQTTQRQTTQRQAAADRDGVPKEVKQQLAIDIHKAGGIDKFGASDKQPLNKLLNGPDRQEVCGDCPKGSEERRSIRSLCNDWKNCTREQHIQNVVIECLVPAGYTPTPPSSTPTPPTSSPVPSAPPPDKTPTNSTPSTTEEASQPTRTASPVTKPPPKTNKQPPQKMSSLPNKLGERLVVPLTEGRILCAIWNDKKLNSELHLFIGEDEQSIWTKTKEPRPAGGAEFLHQHFPAWGTNRDGFIVSSVNEEIRKLKPSEGEDDRWDEEMVIQLQEPVVSTFVDENGEPTKEDPVVKTIDGHQVIMFFLKTSKAHREGIKRSKCTFGQSSNAAADDDVSSMSDGTGSTRQEMREHFEVMAQQQRDREQALRQQEQEREQQRQQEQQRPQQEQERLRQEQNRQSQEMWQRMQEQMQQNNQMMMQGFMDMMRQGQAVQPAAQPQAQPDPAASSGGDHFGTPTGANGGTFECGGAPQQGSA